jgi:3-oxoacyl-[acyl-carrier protein] reductase
VKPGLLEDKRVLITGGSKGLGRAMARQFSREKAKVAVSYAADDAAAQKTVDDILAAGGIACAYRASVTDSAAIASMVDEIESAWGGIDILVNNAGISQSLPLALLEEGDWDKVMDTNVKGFYLVSSCVLRGMVRRQAGVILNISSLAGLRLIESPLHYSTSKAAIKGFTQSLCKEVAPFGIRVNCLAPGLLEDGIGRSLPEFAVKSYTRHLALHRLGRTEEVARYAAFLVSDRNSLMNGATVIMDGGF